jgi:hypothetical protein
MNDYDFYLFSQLVLTSGLVDNELEYDLAYAETVELYETFTDSIFDDGKIDLYQCILNFITWKKDPQHLT